MKLFDDIEKNILIFGLIYADHFKKNEEYDNKRNGNEPIHKQREPEGSD